MEEKDNSSKWSLKPTLFTRRIVTCRAYKLLHRSPWNFTRGPHFGVGPALLAWVCLTNFLAQSTWLLSLCSPSGFSIIHNLRSFHLIFYSTSNNYKKWNEVCKSRLCGVCSIKTHYFNEIEGFSLDYLQNKLLKIKYKG